MVPWWWIPVSWVVVFMVLCTVLTVSMMIKGMVQAVAHKRAVRKLTEGNK